MTTKETRLIIRCTDREKSLLQRAADARGLTLSAYVRMVSLDQAKKELRK